MAEASVTIPQRPKPTHSQRGEQTRRAILDAAEDVRIGLGQCAREVGVMGMSSHGSPRIR